MWMFSQNLKLVEIQFDFVELGCLDVCIYMIVDQIQVIFVSFNVGVCDVLESQMYWLCDMFSQQGMNQFDVNVFDQLLVWGWQGQQQGEGGLVCGCGLVGEVLGDEEIFVGVSEICSWLGVLVVCGLVDYYV